jgi:hypothetical protein
MEKDDRKSGRPEHMVGSREPQPASRPAPGKVTRTSKLSPNRGAAVQRKAVAPTQGGTMEPKARSPWELTMDSWMDAAHRGVTALAERGHEMVHRPIQAKGLQESPGTPAPSPGHGGGAEMPEEVRGRMETAFGVDFSPVRIHEGPQAEAVGALAYTQGTDIHFAPGQYQPASQRGQELLGHEMAHVVQQSQGRVQATRQAKGLDVNDDASLEREADEMGRKAARGEAVGGGGALVGTASRGVVQRKIGEGGASLIGAKVIETGKKQPWTIKAVRGEGQALEYQIDFAGLMQKWISADDDSWSLHEQAEQAPTEEEIAMAALIDQSMRANAAGAIDDYGKNIVEMADIHVGKMGAWSGGASDCVIVGCYTGSQVMMTHADRVSTALAKRVIQNAQAPVYLASEAFSKGGRAAAKNGNVREIVAMVQELGVPFVVFNSKRMAISSTGQVFTDFPNP